MMNKKALSIIGVSCFGAVLFAGSMFGGNTAEAGLNDYGKVSEYSKVLADNYQSVNDYYIETLSVDGLSDNQKKEYLIYHITQKAVRHEKRAAFLRG